MSDREGGDRKTIVVSGVTRGLGRALARGFSRRGHRVLGCGRDPARLRSLAEEIGPEHDVAGVDVTTDAVGAWAQRLLAEHGAPDLLIANAGVIHRSAPLWELDFAEAARVMDVNVGGVVRVLQAFLPAMVERRRGVAALLSSGWGRSVSPEVSVYCASKWAIEGLSAALALELPAGVAAVAVNPGIIDTDMLRSAFGTSASSHPDPATWAERAVPFFLELDAGDNGAALTV